MKNHAKEYIDNNKFQDLATLSVVPAHGVGRACVYTHLYIMCALHMRQKTSYDFSKLPTIVKYMLMFTYIYL